MYKSIPINKQQFLEIKNILFQETGIHLEDTKQQMVQNRLINRIRELDLDNFSDYISNYLKDDLDNEIEVLVSQLTTNVTKFFRESYHYDYMRETILPNFVQSNDNEFTIWSAGCATGQEPYSMAMTIEEFQPKINYKVFASDISSKALSAAKLGVYEISLLENIPDELVKKYFMKGRDSNLGFAKIKNNLVDRIKFAEINLIKNQLVKDKFNIIFCRNVLIYFNVDEKNLIIGYLVKHLKPGGYLCLGHSEAIQSNNDFGLEMVYKTTYQKIES